MTQNLIARLSGVGRVLVTGSNGFVGSALIAFLRDHHVAVIAGVRRAPTAQTTVTPVAVMAMDVLADWSSSLAGVSVVVHCAARVHILKDQAADPLEQFRSVNTQGTLHLAKQAAACGVRRFIFLSTIGVNGSETQSVPFGPESPIIPNSPYAVSKWEAEQGLREIAVSTGMEIVIVRPPLVYGPSAPGNFSSLAAAVRRGIPLPLGGLSNLRSFVAVDNLVALLSLCVSHPAAAGNVFYVCDEEDVSTSEFIRRIASALGRNVMLVPLPVGLLRWIAGLVGRSGQVGKVVGSLQVDPSSSRRLLGWKPVVDMKQALKMALGAVQ